MEELWNTMKKFYVDTFGIRDEVVEMMASDNILLLSASGASNDRISRVLDINIDSVTSAICFYLSNEDVDFSGWEESLKINPFSVYQTLILLTGDDEYNVYKAEIRSMNPEIMDDIVYTSYQVSKLYFDIDYILDEEWE